MNGVDTNPRIASFAVSIILLILVASIPSFIVVDSNPVGRSDPFMTRGHSLDGEGLAVEMASTMFIGQEFPGPGGKLGTFLWSGDLDMDGLEDLAIASSEAPGNPEEGNENVGYLYIWLGSNGGPYGTLDLDIVQPDILIRGGQEFSRLLASMDVGDLDGDGIDDLILGVSLHPSCGRVFILWGKTEGWPSVIDLYDPGRLEPSGDPYGFMRTEDFMIIGGHLAPVPWPESTYDTGDVVIVEDIDKDRKNDLIFSSPGWHHVVILWGTNDRYTLGNDMTIIEDPDMNAKFGDTMTIGDIDNDGWIDLAAGAPYQANETTVKYECGIVFVIFNLSRARTGSLFNVFDLSYPTIWGSGSYDRFGYNVQVLDVDGDGFDDILVGTPDGDGPQNARGGAGELLIFKGGTKSTFPRYMDASASCDIMIYGDRIDKGDQFGDAVGSRFAVGDIDGDQAMELVIGFTGRMNEAGTIVGSLAGYETNRVFTTPSSLVDLRFVEKRFEFFGETQDDNLAYTLLISDINNDGLSELLAGAPGADGPGDGRVNAGEVYVFNGTLISIGDISLAGPGVKDDILNPGGGQVYLNFTFRHSIDPRSVDHSYVVLEPGKLDGRIGVVEGSMICEARSMTLDAVNSTVSYAGNVGKVSLLIEPGWNLRIDRPYDIEIVVGNDQEGLSRRYIPDRFKVVNSLKLDAGNIIKVDGDELGNRNPWLRSSSTITFEDLGMVYDRQNMPSAPYGIVSLELYRNDQLADRKLLASSLTQLVDIIPETGSVTYRIKPVLALEPPPWQGEPYPVKVAGELVYEFKIDNEHPEPVYDIYLEPDKGRRSVFDDDRDWVVGWAPEAGAELDNGSTVRYFNVTVEGQDPVASMEAGGLLGSYFNGAAQNQLMFTRVDGPVDFSLEEWGTFGPDANYLDYFCFSIRWDGWFRVPSSRMYQFSVAGTEDGHAMLILDGVSMIPWSELTSPRISVQRFLNEGDVLPVQVYYYFDTADLINARSAFSLRYLDDKGLMVPIPSEDLLHSSNEDEIRVGDEDVFVVTVSAVDWVGHSSEPTLITGYLDTRDPIFNMSGIAPWYGSSSPVLELGIRDPTYGGVPCSGIDQNSIEYRLRERSEDQFGEWSGKGINITYFEKGLEANTDIRLEQTLILEPFWRGSIQWRVSDMVGNQVESSIVDIGIDSKGPEFEMLSPNIQIVQEEGPNNIMMRVLDRPGSGVDKDTVQYRLDTGGGWSNWTVIDIEGSGTEIIFDILLDLPVGENDLQFRAYDLVGNPDESIIYTIITEPVVINRPPIPGIRSPGNNTIIRLGNPITLDASDTLDDNNGPLSELRYTWISSIDGYLGSGRVIDVKLDSLGEHRIHLYVDDGQFNVSLSVYVTLETNQPDDDDTDDDDLVRPEPDYFTPLMISLILLMIIVVSIIIVYRRYRGKKEEETRLEFVERTEDDLEYEIRSEEEEKAMGIDVEQDGAAGDENEEERKRLHG
ncbi:MAG: hypothetical protein ACMUFK_02825 [Thermoplasmatota archaeon]